MVVFPQGGGSFFFQRCGLLLGASRQLVGSGAEFARIVVIVLDA